MSLLGKLLGKKKDEFGDIPFESGLPPMPDAKAGTDSSFGTTDFSQTGVPSSGVASFMEQAGDDLTGLPPLGGEQDTSSPQPFGSQQPFGAPPTQHHLPPSTGQQLAHNYMQRQQQPQQQSLQQPLQQSMHPQEKSAAHSLEVIDLKLDAIRSELSAISQRIERLEQKKW